MAPHPGEPPIIWSPGGLVTLLRWEGAKIDPGVGLMCCSMGWRRPRGTSGECSPLRGSCRLQLPWGEPGGPRHGRDQETLDSGQAPRSPKTLVLAPSSVPHLVWNSRKETFSGLFFFPFLPNFGDSHAPGDVTTFLGEGHVAP